MSKKRKKSFDEKLRLSKEKQNQDGSKIVIEDSKLKHGDDYRGKIIKDNERFQDKFQERQSKRYVSEVDDKGGQSSNRRYKLAEEKVQHQEEVQTFSYDSTNTSTEQPKAHDSNSNDFRTYEEVKDKSKSNRNIRHKADSQVKTEESVFYSSDSQKVDSNFKSTEAKKTHLRKQAETFRKEEELKDKASEESEVYDPLAQDTDNDGIPDRYDNNFKDSDYFESTYDVENPRRVEQINQKNNYSLTSKKEQTRKIGKDFRKHQKIEAKDLEKAKLKKKQNRKTGEDFRKAQAKKEIHQEGSKKKNFTNEGFTRSRGKEGKASTGKEAIRDREKKKRTFKEVSKSGLKKDSVASGVLLGAERSQDLAKSYLSSGSEDNVGVEGAEKTLDTGSKLIHKKQKSFNKRKKKEAYSLSENDYKLRQKKSKLDFRDELEKANASDEYKKSKAYKKFQKRRQMKASVQKKNNTRLRDRLKESVKEIAFSAKNFIVRKSKAILIGIMAVIILGTFFISFGGSGLSLMMNTTSSTLSTTYLSAPDVLTNINQYYSSKEDELRNELESVESNHPGYDEYIINKNGDIGHNVHELLSYITARCGEVKNLSEVSQILDEMFQAMYKTEYKEEVEIRYRTVTETYVDEDGNEYTESYEEPYEYRKLIINLTIRNMDSIVREVFASYPDNLKHYESLFLAQGNMREVFGNTDLIAHNGGVGGGQEYEASGDVQKRIVDAAYITPSPGAGWCAMWVSQVYQNAGLGYLGGNANDMYRNFTYTSDRSKLQVGMIVAVESSSSGGELGLIYGHVGIYIGDGMVMDNIGTVRVTSLDNWIATFCKHSPVGYGFPPNVQ
jgi:hypothetical protein